MTSKLNSMTSREIPMSEPISDKKNADESAVPVPYSVLAAGWIVSGIAANVLAPPIAGCVWFAGPCVMFYKLYEDGKRAAARKDNPPPREYDVVREKVLHAFDKALKTLPGYFPDVAVNRGYSDTQPQSGQPMHLEYNLTLQHSEANRKDLLPNQKPVSTLFIRAFISQKGSKSELRMQFICRPLLSRQPLEALINHITAAIDEEIEVLKK